MATIQVYPNTKANRALWSAVRHNRTEDAQRALEAGADPWAYVSSFTSTVMEYVMQGPEKPELQAMFWAQKPLPYHPIYPNQAAIDTKTRLTEEAHRKAQNSGSRWVAAASSPYPSVAESGSMRSVLPVLMRQPEQVQTVLRLLKDHPKLCTDEPLPLPEKSGERVVASTFRQSTARAVVFNACPEMLNAVRQAYPTLLRLPVQDQYGWVMNPSSSPTADALKVLLPTMLPQLRTMEVDKAWAWLFRSLNTKAGARSAMVEALLRQPGITWRSRIDPHAGDLTRSALGGEWDRAPTTDGKLSLLQTVIQTNTLEVLEQLRATTQEQGDAPTWAECVKEAVRFSAHRVFDALWKEASLAQKKALLAEPTSLWTLWASAAPWRHNFGEQMERVDRMAQRLQKIKAPHGDQGLTPGQAGVLAMWQALERIDRRAPSQSGHLLSSQAAAMAQKWLNRYAAQLFPDLRGWSQPMPHADGTPGSSLLERFESSAPSSSLTGQWTALFRGSPLHHQIQSVHSAHALADALGEATMDAPAPARRFRL